MWLFKGKFPDRHWDGHYYEAGTAEFNIKLNDLAGGFFCVVWGIKCDLDWVAKGLRCRNYNANRPCDFDGCDKDDVEKNWPNYFGADAHWKTSQVSPQEWRLANPTMHMLFKTFTFLSALNIDPDELHILYLGVSQYLLG